MNRTEKVPVRNDDRHADEFWAYIQREFYTELDGIYLPTPRIKAMSRLLREQ